MPGPQPSHKRPLTIHLRAAYMRPLQRNNKKRCDLPGHSAFIITYSNQQIKNPPLPPQQHQLKILHTNKYIQNDRQKDPGLPLGWA